MKKISIISVLMYFSLSASAAYLPIDTFYGIQNNTFTIYRIENIVAMRDKDGNLYNLPSKYESVNSFKKGICKITVKSDDSGGNLLGILSNKAFQKVFYMTKEGDKYIDADINELVFKCVETKP